VFEEELKISQKEEYQAKGSKARRQEDQSSQAKGELLVFRILCCFILLLDYNKLDM